MKILDSTVLKLIEFYLHMTNTCHFLKIKVSIYCSRGKYLYNNQTTTSSYMWSNITDSSLSSSIESHQVSIFFFLLTFFFCFVVPSHKSKLPFPSLLSHRFRTWTSYTRTRRRYIWGLINIPISLNSTPLTQGIKSFSNFILSIWKWDILKLFLSTCKSVPP